MTGTTTSTSPPGEKKSSSSMNIIFLIWAIVATLGAAGYIAWDMFLKNDKAAGKETASPEMKALKMKADSLQHIIEIDSLENFINFTADDIDDVLKGMDKEARGDLIKKQKITIQTLDEAVTYRDSVIKSHGD